MPKVSKVKVRQPGSRPGAPSPPKPTLDKYQCMRCGRIFPKQSGNFSATQSPLYRGGGGFLPICHDCMDDLFLHYSEVLEDEMLAVRRICMKFDIYWNPKIFVMACNDVRGNSSRMRMYLSKSNLYAYIGKSYDDTIDEEEEALTAAPVDEVGAVEKTEPAIERHLEETTGEESVANATSICGVASESISIDEDDEIKIPEPPAESVVFWGAGLPPEMYFALDARYERWTSGFENGLDSGSEARYKQICILEETINRSVAQTGRSDAATVNALNSLIKEAQKGDAINESFDELPFGVGIRMFENSRPVPKPIPELQDVDGVVRYISVWFLGHLCKMLGIKNTYCKLYEDEIARRRVERPDLDDEDDEGAFNDIFGGGSE